jgi:hypothetical protein
MHGAALWKSGGANRLSTLGRAVATKRTVQIADVLKVPNYSDARRRATPIRSSLSSPAPHRSRKWVVAEIERRTLDGIPFFVNNKAEAPVLIKEGQPIASRVLVDSPLAENRDLSFAHPNLNERRFDIQPTSDDSRIDTEGALFKLHYGHGLRYGSRADGRSELRLLCSLHFEFFSEFLQVFSHVHELKSVRMIQRKAIRQPQT